ncbi:MAG: DUF2474 domain-containing protein [Sandarakinorhabdus sp.]|nr:DUF2474 domain-containing protein [Sandarakinorhabdus sp.]
MRAPERPGANDAPPGLARRLAWFVLLWLGGVASVGAVAFVLRRWIGS